MNEKCNMETEIGNIIIPDPILSHKKIKGK
jgi:hypothetical protein